jgi:hypothetical protein
MSNREKVGDVVSALKSLIEAIAAEAATKYDPDDSCAGTYSYQAIRRAENELTESLEKLVED